MKLSGCHGPESLIYQPVVEGIIHHSCGSRVELCPVPEMWSGSEAESQRFSEIGRRRACLECPETRPSRRLSPGRSGLIWVWANVMSPFRHSRSCQVETHGKSGRSQQSAWRRECRREEDWDHFLQSQCWRCHITPSTTPAAITTQHEQIITRIMETEMFQELLVARARPFPRPACHGSCASFPGSALPLLGPRPGFCRGYKRLVVLPRTLLLSTQTALTAAWLFATQVAPQPSSALSLPLPTFGAKSLSCLCIIVLATVLHLLSSS